MQDNWRTFLHTFSRSLVMTTKMKDFFTKISYFFFVELNPSCLWWENSQKEVPRRICLNFFSVIFFLLLNFPNIKGREKKKSVTDLLLRDRCHGIMYWIWFNFKVAEYFFFFFICQECKGLCSLNQTNATLVICFAVTKDLEFRGGVKS